MTTETVSATNMLEPARGRLPVRRADLGLVAAVGHGRRVRDVRTLRQVAADDRLEQRGHRAAARRDRGAGTAAVPRCPRLPRTVVRGPGQRAGDPRLRPRRRRRLPGGLLQRGGHALRRSRPAAGVLRDRPRRPVGVAADPPGAQPAHPRRGRRGAGGAGPRPRHRRPDPARPRRRDVGPARCRRPGGLLRGLARTATAACRRSPSPASAWASARSPWPPSAPSGCVPLEFRDGGRRRSPGTTLPWWAAVGELALVAAAFAYLLGTYAVRALGATLASFVGLSEVLFADPLRLAAAGRAARPHPAGRRRRRRGRRGRGATRRAVDDDRHGDRNGSGIAPASRIPPRGGVRCAKLVGWARVTATGSAAGSSSPGVPASSGRASWPGSPRWTPRPIWPSAVRFPSTAPTWSTSATPTPVSPWSPPSSRRSCSTSRAW